MYQPLPRFSGNTGAGMNANNFCHSFCDVVDVCK